MGIIRLSILALFVFVSAFTSLRAETAVVAVASNFRSTLVDLAPEFERSSGHTLKIVAGSTGLLFAQIVQGAPYDVFLAADEERPLAAIEAGAALQASRFVYASGRLALLVRDCDAGAAGPDVFLRDSLRIAIANPKTAPYGRAASSVISALAPGGKFSGQLARSANVAAAYAALRSGAVDAALVSQSLLYDSEIGPACSRWLVPENLHAPLRQSAVILNHGRENAAAKAFMAFLASAESTSRIRERGYYVTNEQ